MSERVKVGMKRCPRCGQQLFEDMDVCYGCLYDFGRERERVPPEQPWDAGLPPSEIHPEDEDALSPPTVVSPTDADASGQLSIRIRAEGIEVVVPLPPDGLLIGRGHVCDVILRSRLVSRHHVRILPQGGAAALVEDCGSTNRATLRGRPVVDSAVMTAGDTLDVCGTLFSLQVRSA